MPPILNIIALATFAASLSSRALEPALPHLAQDFGIEISTAAILSAVFAFTYAAIQPMLGAAADLFGKARLMVVCLLLLGVANVAGSLSTSFPMLFVTRVLVGIGAGGVIPIALGLTSDLVAPAQRQVAIGRIMAGAVTGNLLGASTAGVVGEFVGWRGVLVVLGVIVMVATLSTGIGFRRAALVSTSSRTNFTTLLQGYRTIFRNPNAAVCYSAVFIEGCCILGLFPYIASFLFAMGQTRPSIAGLTLAAYAVGGLIYTMTVSRLLPRFGVKRLMSFGGALIGSQLLFTGFGPSWQAELASFLLMGFGFYCLHGCLQVFASELSVEVRATAMALHSFFFFMGQTLGPLAYGQGLSHLGKLPTLSIAAAAMLMLGFACARLLRPTRPADAVTG